MPNKFTSLCYDVLGLRGGEVQVQILDNDTARLRIVYPPESQTTTLPEHVHISYPALVELVQFWTTIRERSVRQWGTDMGGK